jgi:uncharacterized protein (TIGR02466 family)
VRRAFADVAEIISSSCEVISLFPTLVWKQQLATAEHEAHRAAVLSVLCSEPSPMPSLANGESWQSGTTLHRCEDLRGLVARFERTAAAALGSLHIGEAKFQVTGCWATANAPDASHPVHHHPNNFLSGVYYVQVGPGADTINFHDPRPQTGIIRPPVTELNAQNTDQVVVRVENGTLLVFPAYLEHSVGANESPDVRISVSFNVMFTDYAETISPPLW